MLTRAAPWRSDAAWLMKSCSFAMQPCAGVPPRSAAPLRRRRHPSGVAPADSRCRRRSRRTGRARRRSGRRRRFLVRLPVARRASDARRPSWVRRGIGRPQGRQHRIDGVQRPTRRVRAADREASAPGCQAGRPSALRRWKRRGRRRVQRPDQPLAVGTCRAE